MSIFFLNVFYGRFDAAWQIDSPGDGWLPFILTTQVSGMQDSPAQAALTGKEHREDTVSQGGGCGPLGQSRHHLHYQTVGLVRGVCLLLG